MENMVYYIFKYFFDWKIQILSTQVGKSKKNLKFKMSINRTKITKIFLNNNINIQGNFQVSITVSMDYSFWITLQGPKFKTNYIIVYKYMLSNN